MAPALQEFLLRAVGVWLAVICGMNSRRFIASPAMRTFLVSREKPTMIGARPRQCRATAYGASRPLPRVPARVPLLKR
jgi:hypothetical protein